MESVLIDKSTQVMINKNLLGIKSKNIHTDLNKKQKNIYNEIYTTEQKTK